MTDKLEFENRALCLGKKLIAGCDEAGRGPLAGPVCIASVIMPLEEDKLIDGVDDSKKLSAKMREKLYEQIINKAISYKVELISNEKIDEINILNATKLGMELCINNMSITPDFALIDAVKGLKLCCEYQSIIKGDAKSYLIGCASIIAKVTRDRLMEKYSQIYPQYYFEKHKGYGTKLHIEKLKQLGATSIHRKTFIKHFVE